MALDRFYNLQQLIPLICIANLAIIIVNNDFKMSSFYVEGHVRHHHGFQHNSNCDTAVNNGKCPNGMFYYLPQGPCLPCSLCGEGLYIAHKCQQNRDTICDSCHTYKGPHNQDFINKCKTPIESKNISNNITSNITFYDVRNQTIDRYADHLINHKKEPDCNISTKAIVSVTVVVTIAAIIVTFIHILLKKKSIGRDVSYAAVAIVDEL
ncbi:hypothetical protein CHUAL_012757 [Chamberlinius hualienensis]